ncbi:hypothetical protein HK098_005252 [Nowakowskiella sp. JEL0407]|nr:hypothetical protein HK098_005252 [Nowakowskiella sp. JEL0407]
MTLYSILSNTFFIRISDFVVLLILIPPLYSQSTSKTSPSPAPDYCNANSQCVKHNVTRPLCMENKCQILTITSEEPQYNSTPYDVTNSLCLNITDCDLSKLLNSSSQQQPNSHPFVCVNSKCFKQAEEIGGSFPPIETPQSIALPKTNSALDIVPFMLVMALILLGMCFCCLIFPMMYRIRLQKLRATQSFGELPHVHRNISMRSMRSQRSQGSEYMGWLRRGEFLPAYPGTPSLRNVTPAMSHGEPPEYDSVLRLSARSDGGNVGTLGRMSTTSRPGTLRRFSVENAATLVRTPSHSPRTTPRTANIETLPPPLSENNPSSPENVNRPSPISISTSPPLETIILEVDSLKHTPEVDRNSVG